jgi:hypothetical protein
MQTDTDLAMTELTPLEQRVLDMLFAGEHPVLAALRKQLQSARIKNREMTGSGFFTEFEVDRTLPPVSKNLDRFWIDDVDATAAGLRKGAGFTVFVSEGYLEMLEGYTADEPWPQGMEACELDYAQEPRDTSFLEGR